jgi:diguanylate cyclase (GGDEF)-like protein/PAS domain S-box-containing protein
LRRKDGSYLWVETRIQPAIEEAGQVGHLHLTSRDIHARKLAEGALRKQTARFESILSSMGDGVVVMDEDRRLLVVNPKAREYIHQAEGEQVPLDWSKRHATFMPDGVTPFPSEKGPLTRALRGEACEGVEILIHDVHGQPRSLSVAAHPIRDGEVSMGCVAVYRDVTEQRRAEKELAENEQRFRILSDATFEGLAISKNGFLIDANANFLNWVGRELSELTGMDALSFFAAEDREHAARAGSQDLVYEARLLRRDGTLVPVEVRGRAAKLRGEIVRIVSLRDITERKKREQEIVAHAEQLRTLSLRDELTGLYNRRGFMEHARQQLRTSARVQRTATLFFADVNGLKVINDGLGHEAGDRAIASAAAVLCSVFRKSDVVARLGGDEFAVVALDCDATQLPVVRARLESILNDFNSNTQEPFQLSMSMGAAVYDSHAPIELERLLEIADARMYDDKRAHAQSRSPRSIRH